MENLFRCLMLRPAERRDPKLHAVVLNISSELTTQLKGALTSKDVAQQLQKVSEDMWASTAAVKAVEDLKFGKKLIELAEKVQETGTTIGAVKAVVKAIFGVSAEDLNKDSSFTAERTRLADTLAALKFIGRQVTDSQPLVMAYIAAELIGALATLDPATSLPDYFSRTLVLPDIEGLPQLSLRSFSPGTEPNPGTALAHSSSDSNAPLTELRKRTRALEAAMAELEAVRSRQPSSSSSSENHTASSALAIKPSGVRGKKQTAKHLREAAERLTSRRATVPGGATIPDEAVRHSSAETLALLQRLGVPLDGLSIRQGLNRLAEELRETASAIFSLELQNAPKTFVVQIGSGLYQIHGSSSLMPIRPLPTSRGNIRPVGIGDLLVVKQHLKGYEARDLSHVENVLKGEHKSREHKRSLTIEETTLVEEEITKEEERDQQSTERFEMQQEAESIFKEDQSLKVGASISAKYGTMIEFKASTDFAMDRSKQESAKLASTYSKEITNRAISKVTERIRKQTIAKITKTFEETDVHEIDNKAGTDHVVGQYQWIEKIYEAQVFNYGPRLMFDFLVPEPAALIAYLAKRPPEQPELPMAPVPFEKRPEDITESDYTLYAKLYGAVGIEPPPAKEIILAKTIEGTGEKKYTYLTKTAEIPIAPSGYLAAQANYAITASEWPDAVAKTFGIWLSIGTGAKHHTDTSATTFVDSINLSKEGQVVPVGVVCWHVCHLEANIEVRCERSPELYQKWQLKTWETIQQAYLKRLSGWEEKVAMAKNSVARQGGSRSALANEQLQRTELKRASISMLTAQHFDDFGSVVIPNLFDPAKYPQIDFEQAELNGRYIRFFEQAFEWEHMMYTYYPYYWGSKKSWQTTVLVQDPDPQFAAFMQAGAARVVVPVRQEFELAVAHFLETGQIWKGGDPPTIISKLYLSIIDEIKERQGAPGKEVAQGDPWEVRLPTSLIVLRKRDALPTWKKDGSGKWVGDT